MRATFFQIELYRSNEAIFDYMSELLAVYLLQSNGLLL